MIVAGVFAVALLCNVALSAWNFGKQTASARGLCALIDSKVSAASQIGGPKLVFIGGSNIHEGLSAQRVSETIAVPSYNFGLQAGLGLRLILFEAQKVLRSGDTAILVLEYSHYTDDRWNEVSSDVLFGCGAEYFRQMGLVEKVEALLALTPFRIFSLVENRQRDGTGARRPTSSEETAARLRYGDRAVSEFVPTDEATRRRLQLYQPMPIAIRSDADGPRAIASFVDWARAHDVKVVATWPNTIYFSAYTDDAGFSEISAFYDRLGVPVIGKPQDAMYPTDLFYDTQYHLNPTGITRRTSDMVSMIAANRWLLPARWMKGANRD